MKLSASILLLVNSAFAVPGSFLHHSYLPVHGRDLLLRRQGQTPIVGNLTNEQAQAGYQAVCNTLNLDAITVTSEMNNVTQNAIAIQTQFRNIEAQLSFIDSEDLTTQKFSPGWSALSQNWTNILWASRDTATDTSSFCEELIDVIMPFVVNQTGTSVAPALGIEALTEYIQQVEGFKSKAEATAQSFTDLQNDLAIFATSFTNFASETENQDNIMIENLNSDIAALKKEIAIFDDAIAGVGAALGFTILAEGILVAILPEVTFAIAAAGVAAVGGEIGTLAALVAERAKDANQLASDETELQQLQAQLAAIAQANTTLATIRTVSIPSMINSLNAFNNIWDGVVSDCEESIDFLNQTINMETGPFIIPQLIWSSVERVPCLYEQMIPALKDYASGIDTSSIPPPTDSVLSAFKAMSKDQFHAKVQSIVHKVQVKAITMIKA